MISVKVRRSRRRFHCLLKEIVVLIGCSIAAILPLPAQAQTEMKICDVLARNLQPVWKSGMLILSGELVAQRHALVMALRCPGDGGQSIDVCVTTTEDPGAPEVDYATELGPMTAIVAATRAASLESGQFQTQAEFSGRLFVAPTSAGFCHLNRFRAVLVVKGVQKFSMVRRPGKP